MASSELSSARSSVRSWHASDSILMLGTALEGRGGVASVIKNYKLGGVFSRWPVTYLSTHSNGGLFSKLRILLVAWISFSRWLVGRQFLLHVHSASRASFWRKATFILPAVWVGRPVIFHLHGGGFKRFFDEECGLIAKRFIQYILGRCTRIIVLTESWRNAIAEITGNPRIEVIPNPIFPLSLELIQGDRDPYTLLFLGRVDRQKGIYVLLDALKLVSASYPEVKLVCCGDGDLHVVRREIVDLGLADRVELRGWVDESTRSELLVNSTVLVLPSYAEGLPMSILEAMSAGLPVVATVVGGIPEAITDGEEGYLVPVGDARRLGSTISSLLGDANLRRLMGNKCRAKFDARFSTNAVLPRVEAMYRELGVFTQGSA